MLNRNDPLIGAVQEVMRKNQAERDAVRAVNEKFGVTDRRALPHEQQANWDAAYNRVISEGVEVLNEEMSPKQKQLAAIAGNKKKIDAPDLAAARAGKASHIEEEELEEANSKEQLKAKYDKHHNDTATELENQALRRGKSMSDHKLRRKADAAGTAEWMLNKDGRKKHRYSKNHAKKFFTGKKPMSEEQQIDEVAPPGREKQVKELKKKFPKKSAFAIAWASYNKKKGK